MNRLQIIYTPTGNAISWDEHFNDVTENEVFSSVIDLVLNCGCFVYIGAWMPFDAFNSPELGITPWRLVVLFLAILALRRIPSVLLLYRWIPEIRTWREALFTGHFGPVRRFLRFYVVVIICALLDGRGRGVRVHPCADTAPDAQYPAPKSAGASSGDAPTHRRVRRPWLYHHSCVKLFFTPLVCINKNNT